MFPDSISASTTDAADDYHGSCSGIGGRDVVYQFDGVDGTRYEVDLTGDYDTTLYIREGGCTGPEIGCIDRTGLH
ncbi:MAG: hypothetical protein M5R36_01375 [Deltaproteobacteria bacterium]|nr:hypothetical protein [Deltaproteobacteria bacterium]